MKKLTLKQKKKKLEMWCFKNGASHLDIKNKDIILYDGGLFSIKVENRKRPRIRWSKLPNGNLGLKEIKGKKVKVIDYSAVLWFTDLDSTINYLRRMKKILNNLGYKTKL
jgi:hypothetical protein